MTTSPRITVFVPVGSVGAQNIVPLLLRLYQSLLEQSFKNFELLIVDDGAVDTTRPLADSWAADGHLQIRYLLQNRPGRHLAINRGIAAAEAELFILLDPDSRLVPEALEAIVGQWNAITDKERYGGMVCLCSRENGDTVGTPFTRIDTNNFEMRLIDGVTGEKGYIYQTSKLKMHSLPDIEGEVAPDAILHNRVSRGNLTRCIPLALMVKQNHPEDAATTASQPGVIALNARILQFNELNYFPMPLKLYLTVNVQYVKLSLLAGRKIGRVFRAAIRKRQFFFVALVRGFFEAAQAMALQKAAKRASG